MKKIFTAGSVIAFASLVALSACKKKDSGVFPQQSSANGSYSDFSYITPTVPSIKDANGIMVAAQVHNYPGSPNYSPIEETFEYGMAEFTNTVGNFSTLVDADSVRVNGANLVKGSNLFYLSATNTYSLNFSQPASWYVKGLGISNMLTQAVPQDSLFIVGKYWDDAVTPLTPMDTVLHPANHADSVKNATARTYNYKVQFSFRVKNYITNADTVFFIFSDPTTGYNYTRKVPATDSIANFKPQDFWGYTINTTQNKTLQINAVKYNSQIISSKKYYFLKMTSYIKYWQKRL